MALEMRTITISVSDGAPDGEEVMDVLSITLPSSFGIENQMVDRLAFVIYIHILMEQREGCYPNIAGFVSGVNEIFGGNASIEVLWLSAHMTDAYLEEYLDWELKVEVTATIDDSDFYQNTCLDDDTHHSEDINEFLTAIGWM